MEIKDQTILITGGSSGIGLELARVLTEKGNTVLICGRSAQRLKEAKNAIPQLHTIQCDVASPNDRDLLVNWVRTHHPQCNMLVNNAAIVHKTSFLDDDAIVEKAEHDMLVNFLAPLAITRELMPILLKNKKASIVNITTGLVYSPRAVYPVYNATKAALHSFTQVLRRQVAALPITIVEVFMTAVDTPWHQGTPPPVAISVDKAVAEMVAGLEKGKLEIRISRVKLLYLLSRFFPSLAFNVINRR